MISVIKNLNSNTCRTIGEFSILWCHFEQSFFDSDVTPDKIVKWLNEQNIQDKKLIELCNSVKFESAKFLRSTDQETIDKRIYSNVNQGKKTHRKQIYAFLNNDDSQRNIIGCMLYIQRIRNNLFHGLKDIYTLDEQMKMFDAINKLLDYILMKYI